MARLIPLLILSISVSFTQAQNRPLPPNFPNYHFEVAEIAYAGHYFLNSYELQAETVTNMFVLDSLGYVAWYRKDQQSSSSDFKYQAAANVFTSIGYHPDYAGVFYTYDADLMAMDTLVAANGEEGDTHEFLVLANGHKLIGTLYDTLMDLRGYTFNGLGGLENSVVRGFGIQEFDAENNLVWTWHSTDFIHPSEYADGLNYYPFDFDYAHGNALEVDTDGNLIVSLRNTSTVYKIDRANRTGAILWRLGGENSSFTFPNTIARFSAQHYARVLPNGHIGLYDNGNLRWPVRYSRAAEYALDFSDSTATLEWSYDADGAVYARGMGNAQWLANDLVLIGWGYVYRPSPTFSLVNRAGEVVTSLYFEDEYMTYRIQAGALPFALPRPRLSSELQDDQLILSAPEGYAEYIWSTGATTRSITVSTPGTYQVWVPHGMGMVGSYPLEVSEIVSNEELVASEVEVFPNPAYDYLNIHISSNQENVQVLELYNSAGRRVWSTATAALSAAIPVDVASFSPGLYLLKVRTQDSVLTKKVVLLE